MTSVADPSKSPGKGVRRLNNVPIIVLGVVGLLVAGAIWYSIMGHREKKGGAAGKKPTIHEGVGDLNSVLQRSPGPSWVAEGGGKKEAALANLKGQSLWTVNDAGGKKPWRSAKGAGPGKSLTQEETDERQYAAHVRKVKEDALESAVMAKTSIEMPKSQENSTGSQKNNATPARNAPGNADLDALKMAIARMQAGGAKGDPNGQDEKVAFLNKKDSMGYLLHKREAPLSPYEIKTGTIIPAVMISGINSDLPGEMVGQVSQDVYDTATGKYILIPQGARVVGRYDSRVAYGQNRVLVAWKRIVFPDASTIDLDTMPGTDEAGYSGFNDQVNNHYWKIFGQALLISAFTVGIELSQPQQSSILAYPTPEQQATEAVGQQMGQLGMQVIERNMDIQPTITVRPGYRFTVLVNKDMILQPYSRMAASTEGQE